MPDQNILSELRRKAIEKRDAEHERIEQRFKEECDREDADHDAEFTRARDLLAELRSRPRPDFAQARKRRDEALQEADRQLDAELRDAFLRAGVSDGRYN